MIAVEPNIMSLSQNFRSYSVPVKKDYVLNVSHELIKVLKIKVNELKETLRNKEERAEKMISLLEQMTWVSKPDAESLAIVKEVVNDAKNYIQHEIEFTSFVKPLISKGLIKKEYDLYISLIDDLRETVQDVESVFFILSKDQEFNNSLIELESL